jgi:uncharacterized protein involved in response to NO
MNDPGIYILRQGMRPFFLGAGLYAVVAMAIWLGMFSDVIAPPTAFDPVTWHGHEMLYGFIAAAVAGFLLTAIPNWTGRLPVRGRSLGLLAIAWLAGRIGVYTSETIGNLAAGLLDVSFLLLLSGLFVREIIAGKNWKNLLVVVPVALLATANIAIHGGMIGYWNDVTREALIFGLFLILILLSVIAGRVVPSFTRNWLKARGATRLPTPFGLFDKASILSVVILLIILTLGNDTLSGWAAAIVSILHTIRLARWRGWQCTAEPLLWIMHVAYAWLPIGFGLLAVSFLTDYISMAAALHALTAGAMGTMIMAMMTRATLGHSGRELHANALTTLSYILLTLAVISRVFGDSELAYLVSGGLWIAAFGIFSVKFGPILVGK